MIEIQDLSLQRGHKLLLDHCTLRIHPGQKIGLIGANGSGSGSGSGKSSLFKLLLGQLQADTGECNIPNNCDWRIWHRKSVTVSGAPSIMSSMAIRPCANWKLSWNNG